MTQVFARRGYNVQSLAVGPSEAPGDSRITMVVPGTPESIAKVIKQVRALLAAAAAGGAAMRRRRRWRPAWCARRACMPAALQLPILAHQPA